jgi:hypothetical protein
MGNVSFCSIARILGVSDVAVLNWVLFDQKNADECGDLVDDLRPPVLSVFGSSPQKIAVEIRSPRDFARQPHQLNGSYGSIVLEREEISGTKRRFPSATTGDDRSICACWNRAI